MTYPSSEPIVPPARPSHRRRFSDTDRSRILAEAARPGVRVSEVAQRYGIEQRVLFRWRQEQTASPVFVDLEIVDGSDADREVTL